MVVINETYNEGLLEVYAGPMRSGKSIRLIQRLDRLDYRGVSYILFKPSADSRNKHIWSRSMTKSYPCILIDHENPNVILEHYNDERVVAIDEVQFFDLRLWHVVEKLIEKGVNVVVAGLDTDFRGEPFGVVPQIMSHADIVYKLHAYCEFSDDGVKCRAPARMTQRLEDGKPSDYDSPVFLPGDVNEGYEARCRKHFVKAKPKLHVNVISGFKGKV
jgi:thymidine kinase